MGNSEQTTHEQALNESVLHSIRNAGIGPRYAHPSKTLGSYGTTGKALAQEFSSGDIITLAKSGFGLYLHGEGLLAYDLQMMVCRGFVLRGISTRVVSLSYLDNILSGGDDFAEVRDAQVVGIRGWSEQGMLGENALTADRWYRVDMVLRHMLEDNKALVLQSFSTADECTKWSKTLRELVTDRTALYEVTP